MKIPLVRTDPGIPVLSAAHRGDAGSDLVASEHHVIGPRERIIVGTGLTLAIPEGFAGFVLPRSGLATRSGITVANAPGLVDSGYRGEIRVGLINHSDEPFTVNPGDRIAQLVIMAVPDVEYVEVESLDDTSRGSGGFGSTGVGSP